MQVVTVHDFFWISGSQYTNFITFQEYAFFPFLLITLPYISDCVISLSWIGLAHVSFALQNLPFPHVIWSFLFLWSLQFSSAISMYSRLFLFFPTLSRLSLLLSTLSLSLGSSFLWYCPLHVSSNLFTYRFSSHSFLTLIFEHYLNSREAPFRNPLFSDRKIEILEI